MTDIKPLLDEQGPTEDVQDVPRSRRQLLTMAGAAVVGGTAMALGSSSPAGAGTVNGEPVDIGEFNTGTLDTILYTEDDGDAPATSFIGWGVGAVNGLAGISDTSGTDVKLSGTGRLAQVDAAGGNVKPAHGISSWGHELVRSDTGVLWASNGTGIGVNTVWKRINAVRFDKPNGDGTAFSPFRLLDTRTGAAKSTNTTYVVDVTGHANIPDDAVAIFGNVTVVSPNYTGFLTLFPAGTSVPTVANLNFSTNQIAGNFFMLGLGTGGNAGDLSYRAGAVAGKTYHVVIDVFGYVQ
jgi:hypothetical protein